MTDPKLVAQNQPDILNLHLEFLRPCEQCDSTITIVPLKIGATISTLQLQLSRNGLTKVIALATSTNFEKPVGPTVPTAWTLLPPPKPVPKFDYVLAHQPEDNWVPARLDGEIIPMTRRILVLDPRGGFPVDGICDAWNGFIGERIDATYLALMTDIVPSMSDTLMRNGGLYDAHAFCQKSERWAREAPGVPAVLTNSIAEAMQASTLNSTVVLDIEFKRRLPKEGLRFIFTRTATKLLQGGRMDLDVTICNEDMDLVCTSHQLILVLEAQRKFRGGRAEPKL
ncbi:hypothetical protein SLS53_002383 [Cytospora paraplurivora]|uniref:Thioesterase domain-containing protein n=1 Tax=Cytospora paraplurivora TaxID=2898453 RepID=A0AAN9UDT3_9PEZI